MNEDRRSDALARLGERLERARRQEAERGAGETGSAPRQGLGFGLRVGIELVSALAVGVGLGYMADRFIGTRPWGIIIGFFLGAAAGMLNAIRAIRGLEGGAKRAGPHREDGQGSAGSGPAN
jgi:ATP synthase protein I